MRTTHFTLLAVCVALAACGKAIPSDEQLDQAAASVVETQKQAIIAKTMSNPDDDGFSSDAEVFDDPEASDKKKKDRSEPQMGDLDYAEQASDE